jgi:hypothetical protein
VPRPAIQAMLLIIAHLWEHRGDTSAELPPVAMQLLMNYRVAFFG